MSSNSRWELSVSHKDKTGKNRYCRVGVMFETANGFSLKIDPGVSISTPEGVSLWANVPRERDRQQPGGFGGAPKAAPVQAEIDTDDVPW